MISRRRAGERSANASGLDLSLRRRHTRTRRLSLEKQERDSSENTTLCHSVIHVDLAQHHSKYWPSKEMAASDMRNRRHVQPLLTWSTNAVHPVSLD
ncbi:hypothetical protein LAZ67_15000176 [Cordylochernes scorpioides]|uniref:Uncharacterized protein n=1 Tax=Cordylochernes scorpioides TaxID=51811 RepID=A0ABY6L9U3_9ARAC|nr:hypothetical protein LAZ67_15000176 [Cordylochernes scorpioides]